MENKVNTIENINNIVKQSEHVFIDKEKLLSFISRVTFSKREHWLKNYSNIFDE